MTIWSKALPKEPGQRWVRVHEEDGETHNSIANLYVCPGDGQWMVTSDDMTISGCSLLELGEMIEYGPRIPSAKELARYWEIQRTLDESEPVVEKMFMGPPHDAGVRVAIISQGGRIDSEMTEAGWRTDLLTENERAREQAIYSYDMKAVALDMLGSYYAKHIAAMTRLKLHSKADIAIQLAWRDAIIDRLAPPPETGS